MSMLTMMRTADLELSGLGSGRSARGVRSALNCIHGVAHVRMMPDRCHARVTYDAFKVVPRQFETAVKVMGCEIERLIIRTDIEPLSGAIASAAHDSACIAQREFMRT